MATFVCSEQFKSSGSNEGRGRRREAFCEGPVLPASIRAINNRMVVVVGMMMMETTDGTESLKESVKHKFAGGCGDDRQLGRTGTLS